MELLVVGSGAAYPNRPGTASSCYVVLHDGAAICLDIGQGAFAGLAGRLEPADLAGVVVSHLHPDHFVDLVALRHYLRFEFHPPRAVRVMAPSGLAQRLDGVTGEVDFAAGSLVIEDREVGTFQLGPFVIESVRVTHTDDSFATRVTLAAAPDAPALVYSGDCGRAADLAPLVRPGDMLLCEVAFGPGPVPVPDLHLDGAAVGRLAAEVGASQVLLTHLQLNRDPAATLAAVRAGYGGQVALVSDGDRVTIGSSPFLPADNCG
jgi:ribonuclease BN (tRNA processing enzyme)